MGIARSDRPAARRRAALRALGAHISDPLVISTLHEVAAQADAALAVRVAAIHASGSVQQYPRHAGNARYALDHRENLRLLASGAAPSDVRAAATSMLFGVESRSDVRFLLDLIARDADPAVRAAAESALPIHWRAIPEDAWIHRALDRALTARGDRGAK